MSNNTTQLSTVSASPMQLFNQKLTNDKTQEYLEKTLKNRSDCFTTNLISLVSSNKNLQSCSFDTLLFGAMKATTFNFPLDNNLGFAYLIPYGNEAQFQMGYKGYIQLAMRSGQYNTINVSDIRQGELVKRNLLTGKMEFTEVDDRDKKDIIGYVAYFELYNGFNKCLYMTVDELNAYGKKYSKTYNSNSSRWKVDFDAMARKTVLKRLLRNFGLLSVEMQEAIHADQAVYRTKEMQPNYVDSKTIIDDVQAQVVEEQAQQVISIDDKQTVETPF